MKKDILSETKEITNLVLEAKEKAYRETSFEPEPELTRKLKWPIECTVGPGLEGAIACESEIGYVNGSKGLLIYRGYDIFDLCAYSTFEEVSFLLLHGHLPTNNELKDYKNKLVRYRTLPETERLLMSFPVEEMSAMSSLRLGVNLMRQKQTYRDKKTAKSLSVPIAADEDSIPMETVPTGEKRPIYEFNKKLYRPPSNVDTDLLSAEDLESCYHLISGVACIAASIARLRTGHLPLENDLDLSHAANLLYMMTGRRPTPLEERIMDICLILHADHGMNASTFAAMVVASTLSDIYFSIGSGIAALNGPLHGGANEQVMRMLEEIGDVESVKPWFENAMISKKRIMGFGHRVYKAYDPRARVLGPLAKMLVKRNPEMKGLFYIANALEKEVISTLGKEKKIFPNVDFYSGIVYKAMEIDHDLFTPIFAVARVAGWTARILEYLKRNRIFRPRSIYVGPFNLEYIPIDKRDSH
ncbi:MAG: citrate/2-methylcitrate synthase [bacterium]